MSEEQIEIMLDEYQVVYIDGVPLNNPKPMSPFGFGRYEQDLDSGRNLNGVMDRNILDHHPRKLFLHFPYGMNKQQMASLLQLVDKPQMSVRAFDPWTGDMQTATMQLYHGDLEPEVDYWYYDKDNNRIDCKYLQFDVNLIEY